MFVKSSGGSGLTELPDPSGTFAALLFKHQNPWIKTMKTQLDWSGYDHYGEGDAYASIPAHGEGFGKAAAVCIGNRRCQTLEKGVMCPSFRVTKDEKHSTQHRAQKIRACLDGDFGDEAFNHPDLIDAMDLCVACKGCKRECPNGIDMALLRAETLAQRWVSSGTVPLRARLFAAYPALLHGLWGYNSLIGLRQRLPGLALLLAATLGIASRRTLPKRATRSFLTEVNNSSQQEGHSDVVLWVDTFSNHLDPAIPRATVALLHRGGYRVHLPKPAPQEAPLCCGRTHLSQGLISQARREAERTLKALTPFLDKGWPIVGIEPSCLLMFRDEYYSLLPSAEAQKIGAKTFLIEEFLAKEMELGHLELPFKSMEGKKAWIHGHCHQKAFGALKPLRKVLSKVPGLAVELIESSCCGMAGAFGLEQEHHAVSMTMGEIALFPAVRSADPQDWILANGTSCRHQIADGASRNAQHLVEILLKCLDDAAD